MEWISVKDRLPEYYKPVLICSKSNRHICVAWLHTDGEVLNYTIYDTMEIFKYTATHWMELPTPPNTK